MAESEAARKFQKELNAGTSSLVVLALVVGADRPMYGYEVATELAGASDEGLPMNEGALYPVLRSLERAGLLASHTGPSPAGPPRRYYAATDAGRLALAEWKKAWDRTRAFVDVVMEQSDDPRTQRGAPRGARPRRRPALP